MRIMIVDPLLTTLPYSRCLCRALAEIGHEVCFVGRPLMKYNRWDVPNVTRRELDVDDILRRTSYSGIRQKAFSAWCHLRYGLQIQAIKEMANEWSADVVHFQMCFVPLAESWLVARLRPNYKIVYTVHDTTPFNGGPVSGYMTLGIDYLMKQFDRLIVHTDAGVTELRSRGISAAKVTKIPHGALKMPAEEGSRFNDQLSEPTRINFLMLGHMKRYKGIDVVIRAAGLLPQDIKARCKFTVAGNPEIDLNDLKAECEAHGVGELFFFDARFIPDEEIAKICGDADVFVFPYRRIEASGVFHIAIHFGRPFIASNLGIFKEHIVERQHGLLIEPENPAQLAQAIEFMILNPSARREMGKNASSISSTVPDWNQIARLTSFEYEKASRGSP